MAAHPELYSPRAVALAGDAFTTTPVTVPGTPTAITAIPAGGTGAAAGAWDTAPHRDTAITSLGQVIATLQAAGLAS